MKKVINTDKAPKAIGPYSQGIQIGDFVFFSGAIPLDCDGNIVTGDIVTETKQVFKNIDALLNGAGLSFDNVIKTTVFLTNMGDFAAVNAEYTKYFNANPPARSCVAVAGLPRGVNVEIEVIAHKAK
jgi:2-iminobutanoate/2-iminopropanoate deaminase